MTTREHLNAIAHLITNPRLSEVDPQEAAKLLEAAIRAVIAENAAPRTATAEAWEPTEDFVKERATIAFRENVLTRWHMNIVRELLHIGALNQRAYQEDHRIAREKPCSQSGSQLESSRTPSSDSLSPKSSTEQPTKQAATSSTDTQSPSLGRSSSQPSLGSQQTTPAKPSVAGSLDDRAEALFAANPEWRPFVVCETALGTTKHKMEFDGIKWAAVTVVGLSDNIPAEIVLEKCLAALLPRAIDKWTANGREVSTGIFVRCNGNPPRDLESAINILEQP